MPRAKSLCPGIIATYVGRNRGNKRNVRVIAEAVAGRMVVGTLVNRGSRFA